MARTIEIDAVDLMSQMTIEVTIKKQREMRIRLWIATRLIILAAFITGMGIEFGDEIRIEEEQDEQRI